MAIQLCHANAKDPVRLEGSGERPPQALVVHCSGGEARPGLRRARLHVRERRCDEVAGWRVVLRGSPRTPRAGMEGAPDVLDGPAFWKGGDAFNNAMLLPSVWCDEYIWSFQMGVNEYFYGDTIAVNCFPVWRFKRRDRDTVFKCSVSLWASLSEGLLVLGLRMDAIEGPLDAVPLEKLMASPKGGVTMWKRNRFRWFWTEWTRLHPISFRMWKDRFTEEGYFDWPEAAFPEERRLCLSVELGLPARSLYEKTSPSGDGEAESHGGLFRIQRRRSCCR